MYQVEITDIVYKGKAKRTQSDEYVEITNLDKEPADISDWFINSDTGQVDIFTFPKGTILAPNQSVRVYTNEVHPEFGGFSAGLSKATWNDSGDEALLYDDARTIRSCLAYNSKGNFRRTASSNMLATDFERVKTEYNVPNLKVEITVAEIEARLIPDIKTGCVDALDRAIKSFLEDEYEPYATVTEVRENPELFGLGKDDVTNTTLVREKLRERLNSHGVISLWQEKTPADPEAASNPIDDGVKVFFELNELDPSQHWIFRLDGFKYYHLATTDKRRIGHGRNWGINPDDLV